MSASTTFLPACSVIIATLDRIESLRVVLNCLARQTMPPREVIIAAASDSTAVVALAHEFAARLAVRVLPCPVKSSARQRNAAAAEARGFIFAAPVALELNASLVPIRKPGKLPFKTTSLSYELEYGTDTLEIHADAIAPGAKVLVVDDLLATGGTVEACCRLVEKVGGNVVGCSFLIELVGLKGAQRIADYKTISLIKYD